MATDQTQTTRPETNEKAVAAVRRWIVKHGYSSGGADNIEFMLTNLEGQMWDRVRAAAKKPHPLDTLKNRIDIRMHDHLYEMKPDYDDSIVGFNEAWDIVRKVFAEALANGN